MKRFTGDLRVLLIGTSHILHGIQWDAQGANLQWNETEAEDRALTEELDTGGERDQTEHIFLKGAAKRKRQQRQDAYKAGGRASSSERGWGGPGLRQPSRFVIRRLGEDGASWKRWKGGDVCRDNGCEAASSLCVCWCGSPPNYLPSTLNYWVTVIKSCPAPSSVNPPTGLPLFCFLSQRHIAFLRDLPWKLFLLKKK